MKTNFSFLTRLLLFVNGNPLERLSQGETQDINYVRIKEFLRESRKQTLHWDFTVRSFASDVLSVYAFGVIEALRENGEICKSQAKRMAYRLFESEFGWTSAEAVMRVDALESAVGDATSLFAPVIDAGGKAFLLWRWARRVPGKLTFAETCGNLEHFRSFAQPVGEDSPITVEICGDAVPAS